MNHLGIIMDGNGRWAALRGLKRKEGHKAGLERAKEIIAACADFGVKAVSLYVFSTENWKRPPEEISGLFALATQYIDGFDSKDVKVLFSGRKQGLPTGVTEKLTALVDKTKNNKGITVNLCMNYGGKAEIVDAAVTAAKLGSITEQSLQRCLYNDLPDLDLIIRTGGEKRLSNFLLYRSAYAELYFTDTLWPDFDKECLAEALADYNKRKRKFGGI